MLRISLEQWRAFVATAEFGSFQKASQHLNKTPSAINHAVHKMETLFGQRLFEMKARRLAVTHVGKMLLPYANDVIEKARVAEQICRTSCIECLEGVGELPIAMDSTFPSTMSVRALKELAQLFPNLSVRVHQTNNTAAADLLDEGYVRIAIATQLNGSWNKEALIAVDRVCVAAPTHPLARRPTIGEHDLSQHLEAAIDDMPRHGSADARAKHWRFSHCSALMPLILDGGAYAWLPRHVAESHLEASELIVLPTEPLRREPIELFLAFRETPEDCDVVLAFVAILRDLVSETAS
ncbi:MAG: LysR family transcriptional regulator [Pseudomonadota bacterium]